MLFKADIVARVVSPRFWYIELLSPILAGSVRLLSPLLWRCSVLFWCVEYEKIMLIKAVVVARVVSPRFWYIELLSPILAGSVRLLSPLLWRCSVISDCSYKYI